MTIHPALIAPFFARAVGAALDLDFRRGLYRRNGLRVRELLGLAGASHVQSGSCWEIGPDGTLHAFASNEPRVVPGHGLWCRSAFTNLLLRSQELDSGSWGKTSATVNPNLSISPLGDMTADTVLATTSATNNGLIRQTTPVGEFGTFAFSGFAKKAGVVRYQPAATIDAANQGLTAAFDLQAAAVTMTPYGGGKIQPVAGSIRSLGNWKHLQASFSLSGSVPPSSMNSWIYPYLQGDDVSSAIADFWQLQLVTGPQPGPIIRTEAATAGNGAATLTIPHVQRDEDFVLLVAVNMAEGASGSTGGRWLAALVGASTNDRFSLYLDAQNRTERSVLVAGGANQPTGAFAGNTLATGRKVAALRYRAGRLTRAEKLAQLAPNIGAEGTVIAFPPGLQTLRIGRLTGNQLDGIVEHVRIVRGAYDDAQLATMMAEMLS